MKASYLKPLLPLRDIVIFPNMIAPLFVGRIKSINALETVMEENKEIVLLTQKKYLVLKPIQLLRAQKHLLQYLILTVLGIIMKIRISQNQIIRPG